MASLFGDDLRRDADLSECGRYRYSLTRAWDDDLRKPWVAFIMLNPSIADHEIDDPTIRRCIGFAKAWGFAGLTVRNLFALRATDPGELMRADDPIGPMNDHAIRGIIGVCPLIVAAWGTRGGMKNRNKEVCKLLVERGVKLHCLRLTKGGFPEHPLYVPSSTVPGVWLTPPSNLGEM